MNVYRIEHAKNKKGPFSNWVLKPGDPEAGMPAPWEDGTFEDFREYMSFMRSGELHQFRYGFANKEQLTDVFEIDRLVKVLRKHHVIAQYEVPDDKIRVGKSQCAFKKEDAKMKRWVPVREFKTIH